MTTLTRKIELTSFSELDAVIVAFEMALRVVGLTVQPGSRLEQYALDLAYLKDNWNVTTAPAGGMPDQIQRALGVFQFARLVRNAVDASRDLSSLKPHLELLNAGNPAMNVPASRDDDATNKLLELLIGIACLRQTTQVEMDDPERSSGGRNPDVIATLASGRKWAFACKAIHGDHPMTLFERIKDGVDQIERADVTHGVVVLSFKNRLPYEALWPRAARDASIPESLLFDGRDDAVSRMCTWVQERMRAMVDEAGRENVLGLFAVEKKTVPAIVVVHSVAIGIGTERGSLPSLLGFLQVCPVGQLSDSNLRDLESLSDSLNISPP